MKNRVCSNLAIALGLSLIGFSAYSTQTIYGLQNASQLRSNSSSGFYIQLGSFKNKYFAKKTRAFFQNKSTHPVLLKKRNGYYVVWIGPIRSASEVRTIAQEIHAHSAGVRVVPTMPKTKKIITHSKPVVISSQNRVKLTQKAQTIKTYIDKDGVLPSNKWFVGLGGGWMSPFGTDATNFASSGMPGFPDDRYSSDGAKGSGQYSIFAGYQWRRVTEWLPAYSLSLQYTYTSSTSINGFIFVNNLPDSKNFTYKYDISQQLPMAKLKVDLYRWQQLMPYVSAAAGVAFNRAYNYSDSPIPGATLMQRRYGFNSATETQFAGSIGAGLDYWINNRGQISLGYELSYYGEARTGYGQGTLSANRLGNKLNANAVVLQASYFCDWL